MRVLVDEYASDFVEETQTDYHSYRDPALTGVSARCCRENDPETRVDHPVEIAVWNAVVVENSFPASGTEVDVVNEVANYCLHSGVVVVVVAAADFVVVEVQNGSFDPLHGLHVNVCDDPNGDLPQIALTSRHHAFVHHGLPRCTGDHQHQEEEALDDYQFVQYPKEVYFLTRHLFVLMVQLLEQADQFLVAHRLHNGQGTH
mmetsp:Transcript_25647/g.35950  ORF Transcript_25647/g.35950 Transcript_25647/m.35950 type:complete len:202 (-) Transcript_25647:1427-2032(-)